jgi:hypothetical protein
MSLQATRRKVISDLKNYIDLQEPGIAFTGDNQPYPKPVNKPWIHASFIPGRRFRTNIGTGPKWRQMGIFNVNVMVPEDTGSDRAWELVDYVVSALEDRAYVLDGGDVVKVYNTDIITRGILNGYWTVAVKTEFRKDSV